VLLRKIGSFGDPRLYALTLAAEHLSKSEQPLVPERMFVAGTNGKGSTAAMIEVLLAHRLLPAVAVIAGMHATLNLGCVDPAVVVIEARKHAHDSTAAVLPIGALARFDRPLPTLGGYDDLLEAQ